MDQEDDEGGERGTRRRVVAPPGERRQRRYECEREQNGADQPQLRQRLDIERMGSLIVVVVGLVEQPLCLPTARTLPLQRMRGEHVSCHPPLVESAVEGEVAKS